MKKNRIPYILMALLFSFSLAACDKEEAPKEENTGQVVEEEKKDEPVDDSEEEKEDKEDKKDKEETGDGAEDGTYQGAFMGMNDDIKVEVNLADAKIESIEVIDHSETPGIGGELKDIDGNIKESGLKIPVTDIPKEIVENQSVNIDNITGATASSVAVKKAVEKALKEAGANLDDFNKEIVHDEDFEDIESDVVVLGGGGAGLASAIELAKNGKTVTIVEKNGAIGGDTLVCGAIYNNPDEELQSKVTMSEPVKDQLEEALKAEPVDDDHKELIAEVQKEWDEYNEASRTDLFDSKNWYALQTWNGGDNVGDLDLVKVLTHNSIDGYEWIKDLGMQFDDSIGQGAGSLWQRTHTSKQDMGTGFISVYSQKLEDLSDKINVLVETTADEIIVEDGKAVGAKVIDNHSEKEYNIKAKDGVILATGGFAANAEMVEEYNTSGKWDDLSEVSTTNRFSSSQGDGIVMADEAGADLVDMDLIQLLYLGNTQNGQLTKYPPRDVNGTDQIIFINKEGKRFVREDGRRDDISKASLDQTDGMFYMLESGDGEGYKDIDDPDWRSADGFTLDYLKENGYIFVGETLEEIAKQIGCDVEDLKATIDAFNESVDSGEDEFGRTLYSTKLENGPWVATARQASVHHTMGGVRIDTGARVLDKDGQVIPGLYAGGEVTGGIHGANRLGGNAVVDTVVFGKLSADTLLEDLEK
ncbi:FAD-dependent oxidoreductase [uncultured Anaerococcus sp.]|uniref:FAD-dependent oxidoreductase n=1 Tax=uncultured Anaerococcus sp. TaxID=293428 RepID=UPI0025D1C9F1|nr:FAD-dependent oxidoreductase [uncultured Anaerococcus sp.]